MEGGREGGKGRTQSRFCGVSSMVSITSKPGREDCNCRSGYDWGKMSMFAAAADTAGMGGCWIAEEAVGWLELLGIGGVGTVVDVLLEGM